VYTYSYLHTFTSPCQETDWAYSAAAWTLTICHLQSGPKVYATKAASDYYLPTDVTKKYLQFQKVYNFTAEPYNLHPMP